MTMRSIRYFVVLILAAFGAAASGGVYAQKDKPFVASWAVGHIQPASIVSYNKWCG